MTSRIRFSQLDFSILGFISDMKFVTAEQISERFFPEKSDRYPKRRLKTLVDKKILFTVSDWGARNYCYIASEEGTKLLQRNGFDPMPKALRGIDIKNYTHDKILCDVRIKLENLKKVHNWTSELLAQKKSPKFKSDGIAEI